MHVLSIHKQNKSIDMMAIILQAYGTILNLEVMVDNSLFLVFETQS